MSIFKNPFDPKQTLSCSCGRHASQAEHDAAESLSLEQTHRRVLESAVMRAVFPQDAARRRFLQAVGATGAASLLAQFFPFDSLQAMAQEKGSIEKKDLKVGFIPITC